MLEFKGVTKSEELDSPLRHSKTNTVICNNISIKNFFSIEFKNILYSHTNHV